MGVIIHARGLVKKFGSLVAVAGIEFAVQEGECFGFLGPNGAGKTSTMRMISGVSPVTEGELRVAGMGVTQEPRRIKALLGVVPQEENFDPDLNVLENLLVYARYYDLASSKARQRALETLAFFQLHERQQSPIRELSTGMKRRLLIARALLHQPQILILDEPTTGMDPQARHLVWQKLRQLKEEGTTLLLSTHNMEEATRLCDRLVIMHQGRILTEGAPSALVDRHVGRDVLELRPALGQQENVLRELNHPAAQVEAVGDIIYVFGPAEEARLQRLRPLLAGLTYRPATLEDVFLRLTGRGLLE